MKTTSTKTRRTKLVATTRRTKLTDPLYTYVAPRNGNWVRTQAIRAKVSYSEYVDNLIQFTQKEHFRIKTVSPRTKSVQAA